MATSSPTLSKTSSLDSTFPVSLPEDPALFFSNAKFAEHIHAFLLKGQRRIETGVTDAGQQLESLDIQSPAPTVPAAMEEVADTRPASSFMAALGRARLLPEAEVQARQREAFSQANKMRTENDGIAHRSTRSALLDLFTELEKTVDGERLRALLEEAWEADAVATLKMVWNARSVHLGKGERETFYRCVGWMKEEHPETVLLNLRWLVRGVVEKKKVVVEGGKEEDGVMVEVESEAEWDVRHGVSHGYWKDLLNLLVLAVEGSLDVRRDPRKVLHRKNNKGGESDDLSVSREAYEKENQGVGGMRGIILKKVEKEKGIEKSQFGDDEDMKQVMDRAADALKSYKKELHEIYAEEAFKFNAWKKLKAKKRKHREEGIRYERALTMLKTTFYRALHLTVARLFAEQLRKDTNLLKAGSRKDLNKISLAAKWAPSLEGFHDKHTFIASSIAESLYPRGTVGSIEDSNETYTKHAREAYRRLTLSPLRKALEVVERNISAEEFDQINYAKVPSLAMNNYQDLFVKKDIDRFEKYIDKVADGKSRISGAVLTPATIVMQAKGMSGQLDAPKKENAKALLKYRMAQIQSKVIDGQWETLVKRIKDNGKLSSSIAVCDVSGSMSSPVFPDKTCPMDTSIGLSLLLAEITEPPFGGSFITFDAVPRVFKVGGPNDIRSLPEKVRDIMDAPWGMNTDFIAVFERLILPMAIENKLKQEDMVKQIFVFSDMQFDSAHHYSAEMWETNFERVEQQFQEAGYEMPKLVFWNLASGRRMYGGEYDAPKPVVKDTLGTTMVNGYSQAMLKMFLENGQFDGVGEEEEVVDEDIDEWKEDEFGDEGMVDIKTKKKKTDPMDGVWKAIGHKAYSMLKVVD